MFRILISRFLETYFGHRWLYLIPFVLLVAAGGVYFYTLEPQYIARGTLYVRHDSLLASLNSVNLNNIASWITPAQDTSDKINELLRTDAFVRAVIYKTDLEVEMTGNGAVDEIIKDTRKNTGAAPLGSNQVQISAAQQNPQVAVQIVNAVIENYIQWQVNGQRSESEAAQIFFSDQIKNYSAELDTARQNLEAYIEANPAPLQGDRPELERLEITSLQKEVDRNETRYLNALEKEENARLALAQIDSDTRQSYMIIDAAKMPEKPEVSKREIAVRLAVFLAVGVILSVVAVAGGMILDQSFRLPFDVTKALSLPVLATVPDIREKQTRLFGIFRQGKPRRKARVEDPMAKSIEIKAAEQGQPPDQQDLPATPMGSSENDEAGTEQEAVHPVI